MAQNDTIPAVIAGAGSDVRWQRDFQRSVFDGLGVYCTGGGLDLAALPFAAADATAGTENEYATAVIGGRAAVDLPRTLERSGYYRSLQRRGDQAHLAELERFIAENVAGVWDHSAVRLPLARLNPAARAVVATDIETRGDAAEYLEREHGTELLHAPASYVLKLALADILGARTDLPAPVHAAGAQVLGRLTNDNTAPELLSSYIVARTPRESLGRAVARENALRFLLAQALAAYANRQFDLAGRGQELVLYAAPTPPHRLRWLSRLIPADFYRELFMNPCFSGFRDGETKKGYMHLCHQVLSRSRMAALARLHEAGLAAPRVLERIACDTSLLNCGTHLSLGSKRLADYLGSRAQTAPAGEEKYLGDLAAKIVEHFLPLFVGTYSAAPYRMEHGDLRPERTLGFLPNELAPAHLRILWQEWERKAGTHGDLIPDFRLLDYFAALPGTAHVAGLDGSPGNGERLKAELQAHGLFDRRMTVYALYRLRALAHVGFSGFEGRHYSLFPSFDDLGRAADLQLLVTAAAFQYMAEGRVTHADIPDDPETESERRQIFFAAAVGLPVIHVSAHSRNRFLRRMLAATRNTRANSRHPGYLEVGLEDYRRALHCVLAEDAAALVEMLDQKETLADLRARLAQPAEHAAAGRLAHGIAGALGATDARELAARDFNRAAEDYYRGELRTRQLAEGLAHARDSVRGLEQDAARDGGALMELLQQLAGATGVDALVARVGAALANGAAEPDDLRALVYLLLADVARAEGWWDGAIR